MNEILIIFKLLLSFSLPLSLSLSHFIFAGGPYIISCGLHNDIYLCVVEINRRRVVVGEKIRGHASTFYIEKSVCPGEFNMVYYGKKEDARRTEPALYLTATSQDKPLGVGGARASNFTLRHPSKKKEDLFIEYWETDSCYIKLAPRRLQKRLIVGLDESTMKTVCVHSYKEEEKRDMCLRFQLHRTRNEVSDRVTIYRAQALESVALDDSDEHSSGEEDDDAGDAISGGSTEKEQMDEDVDECITYKDDADYFENFEGEFEPISDEDD